MYSGKGEAAIPHQRTSSSIPSLLYTAAFSVVTQRGALREEAKNGCVADYPFLRLPGFLLARNLVLFMHIVIELLWV